MAVTDSAIVTQVWCQGRDRQGERHPKLQVGSIIDEPAELRIIPADRQGLRPDDPGTSVALKCRKCQRNVQLRHTNERLRRFLDAFASQPSPRTVELYLLELAVTR